MENSIIVNKSDGLHYIITEFEKENRYIETSLKETLCGMLGYFGDMQIVATPHMLNKGKKYKDMRWLPVALTIIEDK